MEVETDQLERYERDLYVKAFREGHSVLAIGRSMGFSNMKRIYSVLRAAGEVAKLPKRQRFSLPPALTATFVLMRFSFAQWCNSWEFELVTAETAINLGPWETKDPAHLEVLNALKHDFHNLYMDLYDIGNLLDRKYRPDRKPGPKNGLIMEWSDEEDCYHATIPELPEIVGKGTDWDGALKDLKRAYNVRRRIYLLEKLIKDGEQ
jgi:hypothetical protein